MNFRFHDQEKKFLLYKNIYIRLNLLLGAAKIVRVALRGSLKKCGFSFTKFVVLGVFMLRIK